jgi:hypothetical protein
MEEADRNYLLDGYIDSFCSDTGENPDKFRGYYSGFSMIRVMQALGAFGFRGLYEQKPTFTDSIVPGVNLLNKIINGAENHIKLSELYSTIRSISETMIFIRLTENSHL